MVLGEGCQLLLLQEDDDKVIPTEEKQISFDPPTECYVPEPSSILIIGCNEKLPYILFISLEHLSRVLYFKRLSPHEHHGLERGFHRFIAVHLRSPF